MVRVENRIIARIRMVIQKFSKTPFKSSFFLSTLFIFIFFITKNISTGKELFLFLNDNIIFILIMYSMINIILYSFFTLFTSNNYIKNDNEDISYTENNFENKKDFISLNILNDKIRRTKNELEHAKKVRNINLFLGVSSFISGIVFLLFFSYLTNPLIPYVVNSSGNIENLNISTTSNENLNTNNEISAKDIFNFITRTITFLVFEFLAFYFLKIYRSGEEELRYYERILRNRENDFILLQLSILSEKDYLDKLVEKIKDNENHILNKDETTNIIEYEKLREKDNEMFINLLDKFSNIINKKMNNNPKGSD